MWEPDEDLGTTKANAGYHEPKDLVVRPYKPRPWFDEQEATVEIVYGLS
jgi:hypothetical protein